MRGPSLAVVTGQGGRTGCRTGAGGPAWPGAVASPAAAAAAPIQERAPVTLSGGRVGPAAGGSAARIRALGWCGSRCRSMRGPSLAVVAG